MAKDIKKIYNPANAESIFEEHVAGMQDLTTAELKELAEAYPNGPSGKTYIVLKDKNLPDDKQINPYSTWQNLYELHKAGMKNFVAAGFEKSFKQAQPVKTAETQDLTQDEALNELRNVTTASPQNASFAKDTRDSLVTTEGQGETGGVVKETIQGGDIAGNGKTNTEAETPGKSATARLSLNDEAGGENDGGEEVVPFDDMTKEQLQAGYEDAFGAKAKAAWTKAELVKALEKGKPIE